MKYRLLALSFLICSGSWIHGEGLLRDPDISDGEFAVYRVDVEGEYSHFTESIAVREKDGRNYYEIASESDDESKTINIARDAMVPFFVRTVTRGNGFTSENSTSITLEPGFEYRGIMVLSFDDLVYLLRGYPFEKEASIEVGFLESSEDEDSGIFNFDISIRFNELETLEIGERLIDCYRLELRFRASGIMKILNGMIPKTYFWYNAEPPHYLVAYEGSSGPPGTPKRFVRIVDYSEWR